MVKYSWIFIFKKSSNQTNNESIDSIKIIKKEYENKLKIDKKFKIF